MSGTQLLLLITTVFVAAYVLLMYRYISWFQRLKVFRPKLAAHQTSFTVIIPARNEEDAISLCVYSIINSKYPKDLLEVIVVDDHSTDNTAAIVTGIAAQHENVKLIKLQELLQHRQQLNSYKKKAIETAIQFAKHDWIVTTDADCKVPSSWLSYYDAFIQKKDVVFVAAPVLYERGETAVSVFQELDFLSLQGITAASVSGGFHSMCNGANIAYKKSTFMEVGGFKGIDKIASGDDMLLMHKIREQYPGKVGYMFCRGAVVHTHAMKTWAAFLNQRIRWASKSTHYKDKNVFAVLVVVYLLNLLLLLFPLLAFLAGMQAWHMLKFWLLFLVLKASIEFIFVFNVAGMFKRKSLLKWFFPLQPLHIIYTVSAGLLGKVKAYTWKGRKVN